MARAPRKPAVSPDAPVPAESAMVPAETFRANPDADTTDLHIAIAAHLDMGSLLSAAALEIMQAKDSPAPLKHLHRAIRLLTFEARKSEPGYGGGI